MEKILFVVLYIVQYLVSTNNYLTEAVPVDSEVYRIVKEFGDFCPLTPQCYNASRVRMPRNPCCLECECSNCSLSRSCCPDAIETLFTLKDLNDNGANVTRCVPAQYRRYRQELQNGDLTTMIASCPSSFDNATVIKNCEMDYQDVDMSEENLIYFIPVTDNNTGLTYANHYCAICNEVDTGHVFPWNVILSCREGSLIGDLKEASKQVTSSNGDCNIIFRFPFDGNLNRQGTSQCRIDRCNVTGLWTNYDSVTENACLSYESAYKEFRNVHCYLCNGYKQEDVQLMCDEPRPHGPPTFTALLDFNALDKQNRHEEWHETQGKCAKSEIVDFNTGTCRQMSCSAGMILDDDQNRCVPKYTEISNVLFQAQYVFLPMSNLQSFEGYLTLKQIFVNNIRTLLENTPVPVACNIETVLKTNKSFSVLETNKESLKPNDLVYIGIRLTVNAIYYVDIADCLLSLMKIQGYNLTYPFMLKRLNVNAPSYLFDNTTSVLYEQYLKRLQHYYVSLPPPSNTPFTVPPDFLPPEFTPPPEVSPQSLPTFPTASSSSSSSLQPPLKTSVATLHPTTLSSGLPSQSPTTFRQQPSPVTETPQHTPPSETLTSQETPAVRSDTSISSTSSVLNQTTTTTLSGPSTIPTTSTVKTHTTTHLSFTPSHPTPPRGQPLPTTMKQPFTETTRGTNDEGGGMNFLFPFESTIPPDELVAIEDPADGKAVLALSPYNIETCDEAVPVTPLQFCPKITLAEEEFKVNWQDTTVAAYGFVWSLDSPEIMVSANGKEMLLCVSEYRRLMSWLKTGMEKNTSHFSVQAIVSIICVSLSLLCLCVTFLVYSTFPVLRTLPGLNNMALVLSLFSTQGLFLIASLVDVSPLWLCQTVGITIHFCLLTFVFWMNICTFHMTKVFVMLRQHNKATQCHKTAFIRYSCIVIIISAVIVAINIVVSLLLSDMNDIGYGGSSPCYIDKKELIGYTVAVPLGLVVISDLVMFMLVIYKVKRLPDIHSSTKHERNDVLIFAKLSTITGLTWIFAFLYQWTAVEAFAYINMIFNGAQGVFIMLAFIVNKRVMTLVRGKAYTTTTTTGHTNTLSLSENGTHGSASVSNTTSHRTSTKL